MSAVVVMNGSVPCATSGGVHVCVSYIVCVCMHANGRAGHYAWCDWGLRLGVQRRAVCGRGHAISM